MYHLDVRTLGLVAMMTSLLFAAGLLLVYKTIARDQSVYFWALGASAGVPGFALYALRGVIPDLLSIVAANTLLIAGVIWLFAGSRHLLSGKDGPRWHWVVLAINAALLCCFTYLVPSLWARTYSISAALGVLFFHSALLFLRRSEGGDRTVRAFIGTAYLANALFMGVRLVAMPFMTSADQDVMASANPVYTLTLVFVIGLDIVLGIGLPLLISGRQQRQLIQNEARFRTIVQNSSDAIFVRDAAGSMVYASPLCEQVMGYPPEFFMDRTRPDIVHPDDRARIEQAWELLRQTGEGFRAIEFRIVLPDGHERWLSGTATAFRLQDGTIGLQSSVNNIDQRKRVEIELTKEAERNRAFLRNASDGVHILTADGKVLEVSDSFCEMLDYTRDELMGAHLSLWDSQWSEQELKAMLAMQLAQKDRSTFETRHRRKDGSTFDVEVSGRAMELEGKLALFNSARDISERKRAQEALNNFFDQSMNLHLIAQLDGVIVRVNQGWQRMLGYARQELLAKNFLDLIHPDDKAASLAEMGRLAEGIDTLHYENRYRHKNGQFRLIAWSATVSKADSMIYAVGNDITEARGAEDAQRQYTMELLTINTDLKRFNNVAIGRELRMVELKQEINALCQRLGEAARYGSEP